MKKIILFIVMILFVSMSSAQFFDYTKNQRRTLRHFHNKKRLVRSLKGTLSHKYVVPRKRTYISTGSVPNPTKKIVIKDIKL